MLLLYWGTFLGGGDALMKVTGGDLYNRESDPEEKWSPRSDGLIICRTRLTVSLYYALNWSNTGIFEELFWMFIYHWSCKCKQFLHEQVNNTPDTTTRRSWNSLPSRLKYGHLQIHCFSFGVHDFVLTWLRSSFDNFSTNNLRVK